MPKWDVPPTIRGMAQPTDLPIADYRALALFRHTLRRFLAFSKAAARSAGLQPQHHQLLLAIKGLPAGMTPNVSTLAWHLQLRHHTVVGLIDRVVRKGLARRKRGGREVLLELTPKAGRILRQLSVLHREELMKSGPQLLQALEALFPDKP